MDLYTVKLHRKRHKRHFLYEDKEYEDIVRHNQSSLQNVIDEAILTYDWKERWWYEVVDHDDKVILFIEFIPLW